MVGQCGKGGDLAWGGRGGVLCVPPHVRQDEPPHLVYPAGCGSLPASWAHVHAPRLPCVAGPAAPPAPTVFLTPVCRPLTNQPHNLLVLHLAARVHVLALEWMGVGGGGAAIANMMEGVAGGRCHEVV